MSLFSWTEIIGWKLWFFYYYFSVCVCECVCVTCILLFACLHVAVRDNYQESVLPFDLVERGSRLSLMCSNTSGYLYHFDSLFCPPPHDPPPLGVLGLRGHACHLIRHLMWVLEIKLLSSATLRHVLSTLWATALATNLDSNDIEFIVSGMKVC